MVIAIDATRVSNEAAGEPPRLKALLAYRREDQNDSRAPSWTTRPPTEVEVMIPAEVVPMLAFGLLKLAWLRILTASRRTWSRPRSNFGRPKLLAIMKSTSEYLGPIRIFLPAFPNVNAAG